MIFNSFQFIWLFPLIFVIYYVVMRFAGKRLNPKAGNYLLIAISYGLYMQWNPLYTLILLGITAITYWSAIYIYIYNAYAKRKYLIYACATLTFLPLLVFKYTSFLVDSFAQIIGSEGIEVDIIVPLGISFYTFQAVGYLFDVYYRRIEVERNWWDYMLFVCFFPQLLSGPISKAAELLPQIKRKRLFSHDRAVQGLKWLLWGMFMKVVFADRIGIYVDTIIGNYEYQSGLSCMIGCLLYSLQIYGDFAGYSFMAVGVGKLMGFELINNFRRPYLACSITEFWHRWHISLTRWLTENVYIPMGGSRCSRLRGYSNIMVTFLVSGIWHGANWTFLIWGALHGALQIVEKLLGLDPKGCLSGLKLLKLLKPLRICVTFMLISFVWILFRMPAVDDAWNMLIKIFCDTGREIAFISPSHLLFIAMAISIVIVKDLMDEYLPERYTILHHRYRIVRWTGYVGLMYLILMCGVFDAGSFIYVNF